MPPVRFVYLNKLFSELAFFLEFFYCYRKIIFCCFPTIFERGTEKSLKADTASFLPENDLHFLRVFFNIILDLSITCFSRLVGVELPLCL